MRAFLSGLSAFLDLSHGSTSLSIHQFGPDQTSLCSSLSSLLLHASYAWNTFFHPTDPADSGPSLTMDFTWHVTFSLHHCQSYIPPTNGMTCCLHAVAFKVTKGGGRGRCRYRWKKTGHDWLMVALEHGSSLKYATLASIWNFLF